MNEQTEKEIVNFLLKAVREHQMSMEELDHVVSIIKEAYYTDATIK